MAEHPGPRRGGPLWTDPYNRGGCRPTLLSCAAGGGVPALLLCAAGGAIPALLLCAAGGAIPALLLCAAGGAIPAAFPRRSGARSSLPRSSVQSAARPLWRGAPQSSRRRAPFGAALLSPVGGAPPLARRSSVQSAARPFGAESSRRRAPFGGGGVWVQVHHICRPGSPPIGVPAHSAPANAGARIQLPAFNNRISWASAGARLSTDERSRLCLFGCGSGRPPLPSGAQRLRWPVGWPPRYRRPRSR